MKQPPKVTRNLQGDVTDIKQAKGKYKAKPVDNSWLENYWLERDCVIFRTTKDEESKQQILSRYGK